MIKRYSVRLIGGYRLPWVDTLEEAEAQRWEYRKEAVGIEAKDFYTQEEVIEKLKSIAK